MKSFLKWGLIGLLGLVVLGALLGEDESSGPSRQAAVADTDSSTEAEAESASTPEPVSAEETAPEPTPRPAVSVNFAGPSNVRSDNVVLKGTVEPANARVRIRGKSVKVRRGQWKFPVKLAKRGENKFRIEATRKGYEKDSVTAVVTRQLSAAERAAIRRERAQRRANRRALEAAESYLETSAFSKQGLYEQLSSEYGAGFTHAEAQYAVDHVKVDWNKEAVEAARSYLDFMPMSRQALIEQLTSQYGSGFTLEQATYAVNKVY